MLVMGKNSNLFLPFYLVKNSTFPAALTEILDEIYKYKDDYLLFPIKFQNIIKLPWDGVGLYL